MKSPPELWAEISDLEALARHLGEFGEIRITRLEPETTVAWEGDRASGTVQLEPSGWGTKVTLTAELAGEVPAPEPVPVPQPPPVRIVPEPEQAPDPEPAPEPLPAAEAGEPEPSRRPGFFARLFGRRAVAEPAPEEDEAEPEVVAAEPAAAEPEAVEPAVVEPLREADTATLGPDRALAILTSVLDDLGSARHRPFSR